MQVQFSNYWVIIPFQNSNVLEIDVKIFGGVFRPMVQSSLWTAVSGQST